MTQAFPDALTPTVVAALSAPWDPSVIKWRPGPKSKDETQAMGMAYVDARDVMQRLDDTVGPTNWVDLYRVLDPETGAVECGLRIFGLQKTDVGYPNGSGDDDEALKGAYSDAFKRAAVKWGIGRDLYDTPKLWIPLTGTGKFARFAVQPQFVPGRGWIVPEAGQRPAQQSGKDEEAPQPLRAKMFAKLKDKGIAPNQAMSFYSLALGRSVHSTKGFTVAEVENILAKLDDPRIVNNALSVAQIEDPAVQAAAASVSES